MTESKEKENSLKNIVWLASFPKSGNTWVRFLIDSYVADREVFLNEDFGKFCTTDLKRSAYQIGSPWPLNACPMFVWSACRPVALMHIMADRNCSRTVLKTHHANVDLFGIPLIPEDLTAGAIYLIRDPRDVVVSWSHHAAVTLDESISFVVNKDGGIVNQKDVLGHYTLGWNEHVNSWVDVPGVLPILYEDLLDDPKSQFEDILARVPIPWDEERAERAIARCSFDNLREREAEEGFRERKNGDHFFRKGTHGQWRECLTDGQVYRIEEVCGSNMKRAGYELKFPELAQCPDEAVSSS